MLDVTVVKTSQIITLSFTAPSASPTSITTSDVIPNSFTVQWWAVDCIHSNGNITGYTVRYEIQGNGSTQTVSVSGPSRMYFVISGLTLDTSYGGGSRECEWCWRV